MKAKLIAFFLVNLCFRIALAQNDFESISQFWRIVDIIQANKTPSEAHWDRLFSAKGYRLYISENGVDSSSIALFKSSLIKACRRDTNVINDPWLKQFRRILTLRGKLEEHIKWLKSIAYLDSMKTAAYKYLPKRIKEFHYPTPTVYFLIFDYDGSANRHGIFMNLLLSYDIDRQKPGAFCGHELRHYILDQYRIDKKEPEVEAKDKGLYWAISVTATEGIANLVDKKYILSLQSGYQDKEWYLETLAKGPAIVSHINKNVEELSANQDSTLIKRTEWQKILMGNGHFPGYYMAQLIEGSGLIKELVEEVDNPFAFFYLYNRAVKESKSNAPFFSEKSINYIKGLELKYKTD